MLRENESNILMCRKCVCYNQEYYFFSHFSARKRSLRRLCFYTCLSVHRRRGGIPACPAGGIPACLAGIQKGVGGVSKHALHLSRPTPRGEPEGSGWWGGVSRPTPGGKLSGLAWATPRGGLRGLARGVSRTTPGGISRPTPGRGWWCIPACTEADPLTATAAGGTHPTGMHSCVIFVYSIVSM